MKKRITIPFFIPHEGCPHQCIFCNQKRIAGKTAPITTDEIRKQVILHRSTIPSGTIVEAGFFGGSFTALPHARQEELLREAARCRDDGLIDNIRLSTRPDCIDDEQISLLLHYGVSTVELGAQSFDDEILSRSKRGHRSNDIVLATQKLRESNIQVILQLMIGLPGENSETVRKSAETALSLRPSGVRLYPVIVIADTELEAL
ncbi:MAG TPA: radical SAM protein, partial [Spirochaetota bacterium]